MKEISIHKSVKLIIVDDYNYDRLIQFKWHTNGHHVTRFQQGNCAITGKRKSFSIAIANEIMGKRYVTYDHIDRNGFNNLESNLREVTPSLNQRNLSKQKGTSSQYKGVSWNKGVNKWHAASRDLRGKRKYLGYHINEIDAAKAYNKYIIQLGIDAFTNLNKDENGNIL